MILTDIGLDRVGRASAFFLFYATLGGETTEQGAFLLLGPRVGCTETVHAHFMPRSLLLRAKPAILGLVTRGQIQNAKAALLASSAIWAAGVWLWPGAAEPDRSISPREPTSKEYLFRSTLTDAQLGILGFHLYETREGKRYWNIESQFAELYRESNQTLMRKVTAEFFSQNSDNVVTTRGDQGRSEIAKNLVE
ncbi:MAG: hypothetical protein KDD51_16985, partial [Bdellovibrionales bacterium]|nr:hypothetical protein [Bdellovibrionales bacterium]